MNKWFLWTFFWVPLLPLIQCWNLCEAGGESPAFKIYVFLAFFNIGEQKNIPWPFFQDCLRLIWTYKFFERNILSKKIIYVSIYQPITLHLTTKFDLSLRIFLLSRLLQLSWILNHYLDHLSKSSHIKGRLYCFKGH